MKKISNQAKLLKHYSRLNGIIKGKFHPPVMVDVDPVNGMCNLDCEWCSQGKSRVNERILMSKKKMEELGKFCSKWGVKAWRISGNSEPLLNKNIDILIESGYKNNIDIGLITNGILLDIPKNLGLLNYLGISLDATDKNTWAKYKRASPELFNKIINNIKKVRKEYPSLDISIKFVKWKDNFKEEDAKNLAEKLGCNCIIRDPIPNAEFYRCLATPLGGVFKADGSFDLCCDARGKFVLAKDYQELLEVWGTKKHKELIKSINPKKCEGCAKTEINYILENVMQEGPYTDKSQINFI